VKNLVQTAKRFAVSRARLHFSLDCEASPLISDMKTRNFGKVKVGFWKVHKNWWSKTLHAKSLL